MSDRVLNAPVSLLNLSYKKLKYKCTKFNIFNNDVDLKLHKQHM